MRLFTVIVLIGLLLSSPSAAAQALQKKGEPSPPAEVDPLAAEDLNRAIQPTDGFTNETARVSAVVAVACPVPRKGS